MPHANEYDLNMYKTTIYSEYVLDVCFACAVQRVIVKNILLTIFYFKCRESSKVAPSTHSVCAQKLNLKLLKLIAGISLSEMGYSLKQVRLSLCIL